MQLSEDVLPELLWYCWSWVCEQKFTPNSWTIVMTDLLQLALVVVVDELEQVKVSMMSNSQLMDVCG